MTDVGDSVERVEILLEEFADFQKSSHVYNIFYLVSSHFKLCSD